MLARPPAPRRKGAAEALALPVLEEMLADPPEVILTAGDSSTGEDRILGHPALESLADTRRHVLDPKLIFCGGPTIIRAAERLREIRQALVTGRNLAEVAG